MRTQSRDTSPEAERVLIDLIRNASVAKRFKSVRSTTNTLLQMNIKNIQKLYPDATVAEIAQVFVAHPGKLSAPALVESLCARLKDSRVVSEPDVLVVLNSITTLFANQRVPYYIGGSLASSIYGMPQLVRDLDIIADLQVVHVPLLIPLLQENYHVDIQEMYEAVQRRTSFSMFHLDTLFEVDVITSEFCSFEEGVYNRLQWHCLDEASCHFPIASPEDIVLIKLMLYEGYEIFPDDQWNDILGVLKVQKQDLDVSYLEKWAALLEITALLEQAYVDAGIDP
ncbi:MAG TPA: hypothetical protein VEL31_18340 [Ktedonobacteraceae bacterium]|nr:hypothetical protein [Ktedonobacteraceae bacterium]